jgi:ACS family glucarate transporter-like MFS transporter
MAAGVFLGGLASDQLAKRVGTRWGRRLPGLAGLPCAAVFTVAAVLTRDAKTSAYLFAIAAGLATFGVAPGWAACLDIGGAHAGVVTGAMNTFGNLGGTAMPLFAGFWLEHRHSWQLPLMSVAAFYLVAALCWLLIDAEDCIRDA